MPTHRILVEDDEETILEVFRAVLEDLGHEVRTAESGEAALDQLGAFGPELVFLDITASSDRRDTIVDLAARTAEELFIPFTIGGGIRTVEDAPSSSQTRAPVPGSSPPLRHATPSASAHHQRAWYKPSSLP